MLFRKRRCALIKGVDRLKQASFSWKIHQNNPEAEGLISWLEAHQMPTFFANMLWHRNVQTDEQLEAFFSPSLDQLHDPFLMHDMARAVERIQLAVSEGQPILIYGDYDADGITSTTVMKEAIELLGGEAVFYLPDRFKDGYGPNQAAYERLIEEFGIKLIVTVDNGVAGHEAIAYAASVGVDVIVTDHHELPETLPDAYAIIHPRHPEGQYPFADLAGVGVAFKVATALLDEPPVEMLDLVAIGTIADLVSVTGENRALVKLGLDIFKQSDRIGLQALCQKADLTLETINEENIGFGIGPRLNAIGRLGDASPGVTLLSTFDEEEALELADFIQTKNSERQGIVKTITEEALLMVKEMPSHDIYVLAKAGWHEGVLGIVASRVVQETGRPALVLGIDEETQVAKGSGRSVNQVNLFDAMSSTSDLFITFGGHHMAAGMSLPMDRLSDLQLALDHFVSEGDSDFSAGPELQVETVLPIADVTLDFIQQLSLLAPFGTDNPSPYFMFDHTRATNLKQIGAGQNHLKFQLKQGNDLLDCIGFDFGQDMEELATTEDLQLVGQLSINEWNGNRKPQVFVKDYQVTDFQLFDLRGKPFSVTDYSVESTVFLTFDAKNYRRLSKQTSHSILLVEEGQVSVEANSSWQEAVIVDCSLKAEHVKYAIQHLGVSRVYLYAESVEQCYLNGMPSREQFAKLFKFIDQHQEIDVRYKTKEIARYLKIEESVLIFMIQVFFDLEFVTIDSGVMNKVQEPANRVLSESKSYQERELKIKAEKFLLYSNASELRDWLLLQEEEQ